MRFAVTRDRTFPAGEIPNPEHIQGEPLPKLTAKPVHRHAGCEDCVFLGSARLPAQSLRGMPNLVQLDFDFWYCPTSGGDDSRRYRTVTARFDSEVQAFYTATYPLRTDTDYQRALREAAALAFKRGFV